MRLVQRTILIMVIGWLLTGAKASTARADEVVTTTTVARDSYSPHRTLLGSGVSSLVISYVPALIVAAESDHYGDKYLYIPVAGPWLDYAHRGDCVGSCRHETLNKALLITDGIFQGIAALQIAAALFLFPEPDRVRETRAQQVPRLRPVALIDRTTLGIAAAGSF